MFLPEGVGTRRKEGLPAPGPHAQRSAARPEEPGSSAATRRGSADTPAVAEVPQAGHREGRPTWRPRNARPSSQAEDHAAAAGEAECKDIKKRALGLVWGAGPHQACLFRSEVESHSANSH